MPETVLGETSVHYEVSGVGKPLLLIHGLFSDIGIWDNVVQQLSPSFRVIICDLRGHQRTGKGRPQNYSIQLFADDIRSMLDDLYVEKAGLMAIPREEQSFASLRPLIINSPFSELSYVAHAFSVPHPNMPSFP